MANYRKQPLRAWCSGNKDCMESKGFIQLGISLSEHEKVQKLTHAEFRLYVLMIMAAGRDSSFTLPRSKYAPHFAPSTFNDAYKGLIRKGFIELVYSGKCTRESNRYKFAFGWKNGPEK